jgi:hypothetical protein
MALKNASSGMDISIESVIQQKYSNFEFIFSVADSSDDTLLKLEKIAEQYPTKILRGQNEGIYEALNNGLKLADPESLVCILGSGDFFLHEEVFTQVDLQLKTAEDWCISPWVLTKSNYEFVEVSGLQNYSGMEVLKTYVPLCHQSVFARAITISEVGAFNPKYIVAADRDLIFNLWRKCPPIVLRTVNVVYPQGGFSSSNETRGHKELEHLYRLSVLKNAFMKSGLRRNLKTRGDHQETEIPKKVFPWCPPSIVQGLSN